MTAPTFTPQMLGQAENTLRALMTRFLAGTGLTYHTWVLLNATAISGGEVDRGWLTSVAINALKVDEAAVDAAIAMLSGAQLVAAPSGHVRLTETGSQLYQRIREVMAPATARLMRDLPEEDLAAAARVLTAITDRANEILTDQRSR